ncbi:MAG: hypothetical protein ABIH46_13600, partial [Chloroflexota bacterium]
MVNEQQGIKLAEAASRFLASLPAEERQRSQQEVNKFVRWCGADRPISSLTAREVESYAEGLGPSAT